MKNSVFAKLLLLLVAFGAMTTLSAATEPASFQAYLDVFLAMVKGTGGNLAMALILMFAGYKAYQNATPTPLFWGAIAVVLIAAAPYISPNLTTNVQTFMPL